MTATAAGARLLDRLVPALGEVEAALDVVNGFRDRPAGTLRLNLPVSAARLVLPREVVKVEPTGPLVVRVGAATDLAVDAAVAGTGVIQLFED